MSEPGSNWDAECRAKAQEAADHLLGSCESLHTHYEEWQDEAAFCEALDDKVFECTGCGWWFEQGENHDHPDSGEWVCTACFEEAGGEVDD